MHPDGRVSGERKDKRKPVSSGRRLTGHVPSEAPIYTRRANATSSSPAQARFTAQEKEKVLGVRRQGACLRCRMLKIPCSLGNPCQACLQSAVKGAERKVLSFCYCVRTRFADVNIFDSSQAEAAVTMQAETLMRMLSDLLARIAAPADFTLTSNPTAFNNIMVSWLTDPDFHLPNGSIVGLCCSSLLGLEFQEEDAATDGLMLDFRRFLLATSLAHAGWRDGTLKTIHARDLCAAGQISGYRLLRRLDRILTPQFLSRCGRDQCQVLFLLVLGAVLGIGYSSSQLEDHSPQFPSAGMLNPEFQRSPTLWLAMKEHLCQMLAHHLIFIGSMLGIKLETGVEQRIIETAVSRWNKAEEFVWVDMASCGPEEETQQKEALSSETCELPELSSSPVSSIPSPPPLATPQLPPLVTISLSEMKQFQPQPMDSWSENPRSYFSMFDSPENPRPGASEPGERPEKLQQGERKRRSMWIVRPFDAGPGHGLINVHARLQPGGEMESIRAFV
ncbi:hypothetical protein C7999DRAFT_39848 [Corynascus novoguineensis]|uniref:Zn(2)-C6 fungal-type domain-containing protein n=1 Tax=Corynascus novoguineensis TaxID=1126955 RepID=A0AAN7CW27_9PEZI|nr:hypothetical protein C7999DRAFT_39848 [Corynascus novoguineensis]